MRPGRATHGGEFLGAGAISRRLCPRHLPLRPCLHLLDWNGPRLRTWLYAELPEASPGIGPRGPGHCSHPAFHYAPCTPPPPTHAKAPRCQESPSTRRGTPAWNAGLHAGGPRTTGRRVPTDRGRRHLLQALQAAVRVAQGLAQRAHPLVAQAVPPQTQVSQALVLQERIRQVPAAGRAQLTGAEPVGGEGSGQTAVQAPARPRPWAQPLPAAAWPGGHHVSPCPPPGMRGGYVC